MPPFRLGPFKIPFMEGFPSDFFKSLDDKQLDDLIAFFNENRFPLSDKDTNEYTQKIEKLLPNVKPKHISDFVFFIGFVFRLSKDEKDFTSQFDEVVGDDADPEVIDKTTKFISSLKFIREFYDSERLDRYKRRANRSFRNVFYACDLRGRFEEDYDYDSSAIEDYKPKLHDTIPLVSIKFRISDGEDIEVFSFQADDEELNLIITKLLAAQKELKQLSTLIKREKNET